MKRLVSACFILSLAVLIAGASGAGQTMPDDSDLGGLVHMKAAPELCAEVDAQLNLKIRCAQLLDQRYDFALHHFTNVADPSNLYWNLDLESIFFASCDCQNECATVNETTLNINFPCFIYDETQYDSPITLQRFPSSLEPGVLYWRLVLPPQIATLALFPMADSDCPGTGTVTSSGKKNPGNPVVGLAGTPPGSRGYLEFEGYSNAFSQDQTLRVDKAFLRVFVTDPNGEDCDIRVTSLQDIVNPDSNALQHLCSLRVGGSVIWDEIARGPALGQGTIGIIQAGWVDLPLDPAAVEAMLRRTNQNFIGIGLMEAGDDGDALVLEGWDSNPLYMPQLVIDYYKEGSSGRPDDENPPPK